MGGAIIGEDTQETVSNRTAFTDMSVEPFNPSQKPDNPKSTKHLLYVSKRGQPIVKSPRPRHIQIRKATKLTPPTFPDPLRRFLTEHNAAQLTAMLPVNCIGYPATHSARHRP